MKPLKKEIDAIAGLLEGGGETPETLAAEVIEALDKARAERVTHYAVLRFGGSMNCFFQGYGPFSTKNQAIKAIERHPAAQMATALAVVPCVNEQGLDELIARVDAPAPVKGDWAEVQKDAQAKRNGWTGKARKRDAYL